MSVGHEFNWYGNEADIVIPEQAAIAVYLNPRGDIVIRQRAEWCEEHDTVIVLAPAHASTLARAILDAAGEGGPGLEPRDVTGASRARRYRARHRHGSRNGVTHSPEAQS